MRVREDLVVEVKQDRLLVRRGRVEVEVLPGEIRHLVNALVDQITKRDRARVGVRINLRWRVGGRCLDCATRG